MKTLCPPKNQPENDIVMTPPELAKAIVEHFKPVGDTLDPSAGDGAFIGAIEKQHDAIGYYCELSMSLDFFHWRKKVDWIITNPPWSKFRAFLSHSMRVSDNIVFLATITHFVTRKRMELIEQAGFGFKEILNVKTPPAPWPQSGFQVAAVHLKRGWDGDCKFSKL